MTFMRAYQDMVFSTAARLTGNDAHAEDIAQDVFLRAYEHFSHLRNSPTAGGWLKTVATNLTLNYLTRYRKRWRLFSELKEHADEDSSCASEIEWEVPDTLLADLDAGQRRELIDGALRQLPQHRIPARKAATRTTARKTKPPRPTRQRLSANATRLTPPQARWS